MSLYDNSKYMSINNINKKIMNKINLTVNMYIKNQILSNDKQV